MPTNVYLNIPDNGSPSWKAPVATVTLLPAVGNFLGDVRVALDTGAIYYWNGTSWILEVAPNPNVGIDALIGDVTATGPGVATATVAFVDGVSAANIAAGATSANNATSADTPNTIVKRDGSGNFSATTITSNLIGNVTGNVSGSSSSFTGNLSGDVTGTQTTTAISSPTVTGKVLLGLAPGTATPIVATNTILQALENLQAQVGTTSAAAITALFGDGTATGPGVVPFTLATVNPDVGSFGNATNVATFTTNGKGLITSASNVPITFPIDSVTGAGNINVTAGPNPVVTFAGVLPSINGGTGVNNSFNLTIGGTSSINGTFSGTTSGTNTGDVTLGTGNGLSLAGQVLSLQLASTSTTGALSSTDWNTFNSKQSALTFADSLVNTGGTVTLKGDSASPGASKYYGTNASSVAGYYTVPSPEDAIGQLTGDVLAGPASSPSESVPATIASIQGTTVTGTTGTGNVVFSNSPTLTGTTSTGAISASGAINMNSNQINSLAPGTFGTDAINLNQLNAGLAALQPATSVYAATTANIPGTYNNGAAGIGATFTTTSTTSPFMVDGVTPPVGSRVLIKNQSSGFQNGIYNLTTQAVAGISGAVFTRALDYDMPSEINSAGLIPVINGTVNALSSWQQVATVTTVGTDPLVFTEFTANPSLYLLSANNLSDIGNAATAFANIVQAASPTVEGAVTTGTQTFAGDKTFTGAISAGAITGTSLTNSSFTPGSIIFAGVGGLLSQDNANFYWNDSTLSMGIGVQPASTAVLDVVNNSGSTKAIQTTGYGATVPFRGRYANGTLASPTAATTGNNLAVFSGRGYGGSQFALASTAAINMVAAATFTNTSNPTYINFQVTPVGSVTSAEAMRIAPTGDVLIGTTTDNGSTLQVAGTSTFSSTVTSVSLQSQMGAWSALGFS